MNFIELRNEGKILRVDLEGFDLSIPFAFEGERLCAFGVAPASAQTVQNERFIGDTRRGGSCNVEQYQLIPHCQGTHTECVGHLVDQKVSISAILKDPWIPATVLSVEPERAADCPDSYGVKEQEDHLISKRRLLKAWHPFHHPCFQRALIIRTLPNEISKRMRSYRSAPYFSQEAMEEIIRRPVQHLLVDLPSIDRMDDRGRLSNHRLFWGMPLESHDLNDVQAPSKTVTELIFVPEAVQDGYYLLNLQIAPFMSDAAPSRPLLFPVEGL